MHYPLKRLSFLIDKRRCRIYKIAVGSFLESKLLLKLIRTPQIIRIDKSYPFTFCKIDSPDSGLKSTEVIGIYVIAYSLIPFSKRSTDIMSTILCSIIDQDYLKILICLIKNGFLSIRQRFLTVIRRQDDTNKVRHIPSYTPTYKIYPQSHYTQKNIILRY